MRVTPKDLFYALSLTAIARAQIDTDLDDLEDTIESITSSVLPSSSSSTIQRSTFTPSTIKGAFVEQFADAEWSNRWTPSHATKDEEGKEEQFSYVGQWSVEEPTVFKGIEGDAGLVAKNPAAHHAISASFAQPVDNKDNTLVVQYEVKLQQGLECGGAYVKLLTKSDAGIKAQEFSNKTPYTIMFGPDKCGMTNKNPVTGEYEEKHLTMPPMAKINKLTNLYTLIIRPDQSFEVQVNGEEVKKGNLLEHFSPAFNPEAEIDDPEDSKPSDWVDEAKISDPEAAKPEDWDEDAPFEIEDVDAEKPDDWLENEPAEVPDPNTQKPEDWDEEEDGDFEAPLVPNPKCEDVSGCGPWKRPTIKNPAYKGKWYAPKIDNPLYKGIWAPRKIANPGFYEDKTPSNLEPIEGIGFEIWTMQGDILFDNIYIGHSEADAKAFAKETYDVKASIEKAEEDAAAPKLDEKLAGEASSFAEKFEQLKSNPVGFIRTELSQFFTLLKKDPMFAIQNKPEVAGTIALSVLTLLAVLGGILGIVAGSSVGAADEPITLSDSAADASPSEAKITEIKDEVKDASDAAATEPTLRRSARNAGNSSD